MDPGTPNPNGTPAPGTVAEPFPDRPAVGGAFLSPPELPDEIGRLAGFRVLDELGRGGMGVVFRAEEIGLKRQVALKVMLPSATASPGAVRRFLREAEAQAKVEHDHIIPIYRVDEANGVSFLAMPLLKGQTLGAALKLSRCPPVAEVVRIGAEMADGLAAAHDAGLIHRDIKPANVWLEGNKRRVKILDFGLARVSAEPAAEVEPQAVAVDGEPGATADVGTFQTAAGAVMGTPAYMAPEQARGQPTDSRTDLFSLGVVLYEMAAGRKPFTGPSSMDEMAAVVTLHPQPPHELNPDVPPQLSELIRRLMAKDASQRPATASEVAEELEQIGRGLDPLPVVVMPVGDVPGAPNPWADIADTEAASAVPSGRSAAVPALRPPTSRKPLLFAAFTLLLAGAIVAAVVVTMNRSKGPRDADPPPDATVTPPKKDDPAPPKPKDATASGTTPSVFFNGKDLSGWTDLKGAWKVVDGALVGTLLMGKGVCHLTTVAPYADFELSFRIRSQGPRGNGAWSLGFRRDKAAEVNTSIISTGKGIGTSARIGGKSVASRENDFNDVSLRCVGKWVTVVVNGETIVNKEFDLPLQGTLSWGPGSAEETTTVRDIRFTDLSFFNGKDLTGWNAGKSDIWKVVNGEIVGNRAANNKSAAGLNSERAYKDFELSFQLRRPADASHYLSFTFRNPRGATEEGARSHLMFSAKTVSMSRVPKASVPIRNGEFNDVTVRCVGKQVKVVVNGSVLFDGDFDIAEEGYFGFSYPTLAGEVVIRNIQFTDLSEPAKK